MRVGGQDGQPVGVDDDRKVGVEHVCQRADGGLVGAQSRSDHPGLDPSGRRHPGHRDDLRPVRKDLRRGRPGVTHHPGGGRDGRTAAQDGRTRVGRRAGDDPDDTLGVLVVVRTGQRPACPDVGGIQAEQTAVGKVQTDVDEFDAAAVGQRVNGFEAAECHGERCPHGGTGDRTGVDVDAAGDVDGDHRDPGGRHGGEHLGGGRAQRPGAGDPDDPVDHQICGGRRAGHHPAPGGPERGQRPGVGVLGVEQDSCGRHAPAPQEGGRPQCVTAVVPGSDHRTHRAPGQSGGATAQFGGDSGGQAGRGAAHQRAIGQAGQQWGFGGPDLPGGVVVPHQRAIRR